jgi:membrane-bound lytic murein transglycosylase B
MGLMTPIFTEAKFFFGCLLIFILFSPVPSTQAAKNDSDYFESLQKRLIRDGFDRDLIQNLYEKPQVNFETDTVSSFFAHKEARLNYDQFTDRTSIKKAKKYMEKHQAELANAEKIYGVDQKIITAIILVESRLGILLGKKSVLNILSSLASLSEPKIREMLWKSITIPDQVKHTTFEKWALRKSKWAYTELKAFIEYVTREGIDPVSVTGSYAGAIGIPQFMPSNILYYAEDGNRDERINLFNHADAIASIASYLKQNGWRPKISRKNAYKVIYRYNHSKYYVNTILKISELLEG